MRIIFRLLTVLTIILFTVPTWAQEIKVKSFTQDVYDLTAQQVKKLDLNGDMCALVKVQILDDAVEFDGDIVESSHSQQNEYWVWLVDGSTYLQVSPKSSLPLTIEFVEVNPDISEVKGGRVYDLVISMPEAGLSFETALRSAREHYDNRVSNTHSSFYEAAVLAYDRAKMHIDCPDDIVQVLRTEQDTLKSIRKTTYFLEKCDSLILQNTQKYGYESDNVYKYLAGRYKFSDRLVKYHPEIEGFVRVRDQAFDDCKKHPKSKILCTDTVTRQRLVVSGRVKTVDPAKNIHVYACNLEKPKRKELKMLGGLRDDYTFTVIMPDGYNYIIVDGENKAHHVSPNEKVFDIDLTDN